MPDLARAEDDDDEREHRSSRSSRETRQDEVRKHEEEKERERQKKRGREDEQKGGTGGRGSGAGGTRGAAVATNAVYTDICGACHAPYAPQLLPARSWARILAQLDKHFGETPDADAKAIATISAFLAANAADHADARPGPAIMKSIGGGTPERITDIPFIRGKHHEISDAVFARKAVGSRSNCSACHPGAVRGEFHEDAVRIPR